MWCEDKWCSCISKERAVEAYGLFWYSHGRSCEYFDDPIPHEFIRKPYTFPVVARLFDMKAFQ